MLSCVMVFFFFIWMHTETILLVSHTQYVKEVIMTVFITGLSPTGKECSKLAEATTKWADSKSSSMLWK